MLVINASSGVSQEDVTRITEDLESLDFTIIHAILEEFFQKYNITLKQTQGYLIWIAQDLGGGRMGAFDPNTGYHQLSSMLCGTREKVLSTIFHEGAHGKSAQRITRGGVPVGSIQGVCFARTKYFDDYDIRYWDALNEGMTELLAEQFFHEYMLRASENTTFLGSSKLRKYIYSLLRLIGCIARDSEKDIHETWDYFVREYFTNTGPESIIQKLAHGQDGFTATSNTQKKFAHFFFPQT